MNRCVAAMFALTLCGFAPSFACAAPPAPAPAPARERASAPGMELIRVDGNHFVERDSKRTFSPWGFNYDRNNEGGLLESYWHEKWPQLQGDFQEMQELGADVVRIHLQFGEFMDAPDKPNEKNLARLKRLVRLAKSCKLRLDLTGLACYRKPDVPAWYDALDEDARWSAQANFWTAVAGACADSPAIFCYDLMNEPIVPDKPLPAKQWLHPFAFGGYYFVQFIVLDPGQRDRTEIARAWIRRMTQAIRSVDKQHLITLGMLPNSLASAPGATGFDPAKLAGELDFLCTHIYPVTGTLDEALATTKGFADAAAGKPLVVEEIFPLTCDAADVGRFIERSRPFTAGYIGFYWGKPIAELSKSDALVDKQVLSWLEVFQKLNPNPPRK